MSEQRAVPAALAEFFADHPRLALAFSGGTDSAYLLYAATACGCDVRAYYARSAFQPEFERQDALRLAEQLGASMREVPLDVLAVEDVRANPENRCYYCKQAIFTALTRAARADGYSDIMDGTNASDDAGDRPGMKALAEIGVLSPLRLCGITKAGVRTLSRQAGLFTADKPAYACLATRIPAGTPIDADTLKRVEGAEGALFLVDAVEGLRLPGEARAIVHGDALSYMIGAASVVAKVTRDRYMVELDAKYPMYGFARNKGYGTAEHIAALKKYGPCPEHRRSFIGKILGGSDE